MAPPAPNPSTALPIERKTTPLIHHLDSSSVQALFAHHPDSPSDLALLKNFICSSYVNVLLVAVPLSFLSHFLHWGSMAAFIISFIAIIPLAISLATPPNR